MWSSFALALAGPVDVEHRVEVLDNGLTVILAEDDNTDTIALHLHYGVGARDERPGEYGCAHLFEHLMFEGSEHVPGSAFDDWLAGAGGDNNAFTSSDQTAYHMTFPSGALDLALMLESDRMGFLEAELTQANLDNQQKVVLQERAEGFERPGGRTWDALDLVGWPEGHPYQHMVIGTIADVEGFTLEGVVDFWKRHYRPRNAVLSLVGNFETEAALERVEHWFSDIPDTGAPEPRAQKATVDPQAVQGAYKLEDRIEDHRLYLSWPTVDLDHPDAYALDVLAELLFGGRGTRLSDALYYDKSVVSDIGAFSYTPELAGMFIVYLHADDLTLPEVRKKFDKAWKKALKKPFTAAEIERAVKTMRAGELDGLETLEDRAQVLVDCYRHEGDANCTADRIARYQAVTPADLTRVLAYFEPEPMSISVVPAGSDAAIEGATLLELP